MEPIYRIKIEFETREEADACLTLLGNWEASELMEAGGDENAYIDPPENPFAVYSIEEVTD
jgi:hypothetical protein